MAADAAYRKAVELLARRAHFEREIRRKLRSRGFEEDECAEVMTRLRDEGLVDDRESAAIFVEGRLRRGPMGRRRLRAELERRGARAEAVEAALESLTIESERELAREAARRFKNRRTAKPDALLRHLDRLGFSPHDILAVAEEHETG